MSEPRKNLVLTQVGDEDGFMRRSIHLTAEGQLVIEGHDLGAGVERIFGCREYEFERTLSVGETAQLAELLEVSVVELLPAIQQRFGTTPPLEAYLEEHDIAGEFWNRTGD